MKTSRCRGLLGGGSVGAASLCYREIARSAEASGAEALHIRAITKAIL